MKTLNSFFLLLLVLFFIGCASDDPAGKTEAEVLFKEAQELMDAERYIMATEKLNQIKTQHPYSYYATPAELLLAEVQYKQENYVESAASFLLFRDLHPKHEKIAYVIFMTGESYYKQLPDTIDRDLEAGLEAMKYYNEIIDRYSSTEYVAKAQKRIKKCQKMLTDKDLYVADFYFKTKVYEAARFWYLDILTKHAGNEKIKQHSMMRIVASSMNMKEYETCLNYVEKFTAVIDKDSEKELKSYTDTCQTELSKNPAKE